MLALLLAALLQTQLLVNFLPDGVEKNLRRHVEAITADSLKGRAPGSAGEREVAAYIYKELNSGGVTMLSPEEGEDFIINDTINGRHTSIHSRNVIGIVEGCDPVLRNEFIVVGAHYDNIGTSTMMINGEAKEVIYPGADGNASGVAALLELAKQVQQQKFLFRRSVIFAFFGAGEESCAGSWYFLNRSFSARDKIVLMVNLNNVGRSGGKHKFQLFTGLHNLMLTAIAKDVEQRTGSLSPAIANVDGQPSDHRTFNSGNIPIALFTTGYGSEYHTAADRAENLDYGQMVGICEYVMAFVHNISERDERITESNRSAVEDSKLGKESERIYTQWEVDQPAKFLHGGQEQFLRRWVYKYVKFPESALNAGIHGRVVAEFVVDKDGTVGEVKITKGLSDDIDKEVIKVISASPKWKGAVHHNKRVKVKISVPVDFKIRGTGDRARFGIKK